MQIYIPSVAFWAAGTAGIVLGGISFWLKQERKWARERNQEREKERMKTEQTNKDILSDWFPIYDALRQNPPLLRNAVFWNLYHDHQVLPKLKVEALELLCSAFLGYFPQHWLSMQWCSILIYLRNSIDLSKNGN